MPIQAWLAASPGRLISAAASLGVMKRYIRSLKAARIAAAHQHKRKIGSWRGHGSISLIIENRALVS